MDLRFKLAHPSNIEDILTMMSDFYAIDNYPFDKERNHRNLSEFIQNQHLGRLWILIVDNFTIGYVILTFGYSFEYGGRDAFIDEFYITEPYRGKGFGSKVLKYVEYQAQELQVKTLHLEVENHNDNANKLYLKAGFTSNDRTLLNKNISV